MTTALLILLCFPWAWRRLRRTTLRTPWLVLVAVAGIPWFLVSYAFVGVLLFAAMLPPLDLSLGDGLPRTIRNSGGNYESTFLKTARETNGAYELIQVQVLPRGGNVGHYHRDFEETFTTLRGELTVKDQGRTLVLRPGESHTVRRGHAHSFHNETTELTEMTVKVTPARGLEKSLRVTYGLANTNGWTSHGLTRNPWHLPLLLGYSGTYLDRMPGFLQEPLVWAFARIAQWKGEDRSLKQFF